MKTETSKKRLKKSHKTLKRKLPLKFPVSSTVPNHPSSVASILMLTTFPPRECGIATYSRDLIESLKRTFGESLRLDICALHDPKYPLIDLNAHDFQLNTDDQESYNLLTSRINASKEIAIVMVQHEFGLFNGCSEIFVDFLKQIEKPIVLSFHTVLPNPDASFLEYVKTMSGCADKIIVMTQSSASILTKDYGVHKEKIEVINHGTHLIKHKNKKHLKEKYDLNGKTVLSTFGLLGPGKSIETTLDALPEIVQAYPEVTFLILGKTHPTLAKAEGEKYRNFLIEKVHALQLEKHVRFINEFLPLDKLLEYLQLTDIYVFTSKDPNQAVSGTFAYAMSCGCPIISTPIPHAKEFLSENKGLLFDFEDSGQLSNQLNILLGDKQYRKNLGLNGLHASSATSWENSALAHGKVFQSLSNKLKLNYHKPPIKFDHLHKMTTPVGMIQFSSLNQPDIRSGYTLDDNARALIVICETYRLTGDDDLLKPMSIYLNFILRCQRFDGTFLNYVDAQEQFTDQNDKVNLEDSNGRAMWALGSLIGLKNALPKTYDYFFHRAKDAFEDYLQNIQYIHSPRAMAFIIKGIRHSGLATPESLYYSAILTYGERLFKMYQHESKDNNWYWFESYLTYGNSILSEAMLDAFRITGNEDYKSTAIKSFNFLLEYLFTNDRFQVISNKTWLLRGDSVKALSQAGQQPIDVAYTILALKNFYELFPGKGFEEKMELAFSWFLGNNHLSQIVYNPCTTGCFDGLELNNVNLNQGAESTISYLLARLAFDHEPSELGK